MLPRLHTIIDVEVAGRAGWTPDGLAAACVAGGARFLQVRAKSLGGAAFLEVSARIVDLAHRAGAIVVVNDRADIARLAAADGVHLGQQDLSPASARTIVGAASIVGRSTHSRAQVDAALAEPVTYVAVGPIFETTTKATGYAPVGLDLVRWAAAEARRRGDARPIVAIGGITLETAPRVLEAGAAAVAIVGDVLSTGDPEARVRATLARLAQTGGV